MDNLSKTWNKLAADQNNLDESLRKITTLSVDPLTKINFMRKMLGSFRYGKDEEPKREQFQNHQRRVEIK